MPPFKIHTDFKPAGDQPAASVQAAASPLYRIVQDCLETYLAEAAPDGHTFCAKEALRRFLEQGSL